MLQTFGRGTKPGRWTNRRNEHRNITIIPKGRAREDTLWINMVRDRDR